MSDPNTLIPVRAPDGSIGTVPAAQLREALDAGAEQVSGDVLAQAERAEKYGDVKGQVLAGAAGAARGLTFGLSDAALTDFDPTLRDPLNALREVNPNASLAGELAGAVAPTLLSGGAGAAGAARGLSVGGAVRGLGAIPRGATALGGLAERGVARIVGEGATSTLGAAAQRGLSLGARGAAEGALYGAGHEVSEAALGDYEATAERLMAGAKSGALMGLAVGGALGASGPLLRGAASKADDVLEAVRVPSSEAGGGVRQKLSEVAEDRAFKSLSPTKADERAAQRFAGDPKAIGEGARKIGRHMLDELPAEMGKRFELASTEEIAEAAGRRAKAIGEKLGAKLDKLDEAFPPSKFGAPANDGFLPRVDTIAKRVNDEVLAPLRQLPGYEGVISHVDGYLASLSDKAGSGEVTFSRLQKIRAGLDDLIYRGKQPNVNPSPAIEELRKVRGIIESELIESGERAAATKGEAFAAEYKDLKSRYQSMRFAEKVATEAEMRGASNRTISMTDYLAGVGGLALGQPALGVLAPLANKMGRERGNQVIAGLLDRATRLRQVETQAASIDRKIEKGVRSFFAPAQVPRGTAAVPAIATAPLAVSYSRAVERVKSHEADPQKLAARMATRIGDLADHAPKVSAAAAAIEARKVSYLASKIPPGHRPMEGLQPHLAKPKVSDAEKAKFLRHVRGAEEPLSILDDLKAGKLSREGIDAVRTLYPSLYEGVRSRALESLAKSKEPVPYQKQVQLGILFGAATHPSLRPQTITQLQKQWSDTRDTGGEGPRARAFSLSKPDQALTAVEKMETS